MAQKDWAVYSLDRGFKTLISSSTSRDLFLLNADSVIITPDEGTYEKYAAFIPLIRVTESDDNSTFTNVDENMLRRYANGIAYMGRKRYIRASVAFWDSVSLSCIEIGGGRAPISRPPSAVWGVLGTATRFDVYLTEPCDPSSVPANGAGLLTFTVASRVISTSAVALGGRNNENPCRLRFTIAATGGTITNATRGTFNFNGSLLRRKNGEPFQNTTGTAIDNDI